LENYKQTANAVHTIMSVLLIVGRNASHAALSESRWVCRRDRLTDGRTQDSYVTLSARRGNRNNTSWAV